MLSDESQSLAPAPAWWNPLRWPLYLRIVLAVVVGTLIGVAFGKGEILLGWTNADLGVLAGLYIQVLTVLATPLIFLAIADAFVHTEITFRQGAKMFAICAVNIVAAFAIGLTILNVWQPGTAWQDSFVERAAEIASAAQKNSGEAPDAKAREVAERAAQSSLSPLAIVKKYVPTSIAQPFADNMVLTVAVLAIAVGAAMRSIKKHTDEPQALAGIRTFELFIVGSYQIVLRILAWLIEIAPYAIGLAVAGVVGATGLEVFKQVAVFFVTVVAALSFHSLVYYPLSAWLIGGVSPRRYFGQGISAILTGFSINSSLATAPLTLDALRRMGVSESSSRLSACVGTNFNNDGITLYEAITALFVAQAAGYALSLSEQITILVAALAGSAGIAGIPNSGLIILPLVLKAANLPNEVIVVALSIVFSIDFINARLRSAVNVMGDMQVAILLDAGGSVGAPAMDHASETPCEVRSTAVESPAER